MHNFQIMPENYNMRTVKVAFLLLCLFVSRGEQNYFCYITMPPPKFMYDTAPQIDFYEKHSNLITCGLRRVETGKTSADFTLAVYHRRSTPYEVTIENIKERADAPYYAIRLFMKSDKRMFVAYETKSSETILAEYQLRKNGLVHVDSRNAGRFIDTWRITDSEEGFYDALTCQMFGTTDKHPNCPCRIELYHREMCIYDHFRKVYERTMRDESNTYLLTFNIYNCLHFHEGDNRMKWNCRTYSCNENITSTSFITKDKYIYNSETGICLDGVDNVRQLQFYDLKWDIPGRLPKSIECRLEYIKQMADEANEISVSHEVEENEKEEYQLESSDKGKPTIQSNENIIRTDNGKKICWSPTWTITLFCLDGVLILTAIFVFLAGSFGRDAKRRKY